MPVPPMSMPRMFIMGGLENGGLRELGSWRGEVNLPGGPNRLLHPGDRNVDLARQIDVETLDQRKSMISIELLPGPRRHELKPAEPGGHGRDGAGLENPAAESPARVVRVDEKRANPGGLAGRIQQRIGSALGLVAAKKCAAPAPAACGHQGGLPLNDKVGAVVD